MKKDNYEIDKLLNETIMMRGYTKEELMALCKELASVVMQLRRDLNGPKQ